MIIKAGKYWFHYQEEKLEEKSLVSFDSIGTDNAFLCKHSLIQ